MKVYEYGSYESGIVLIQPVDEHDMAGLEAEAAEIQRLTAVDFRLSAVKTESWNRDLSPWKAPPVYGGEDFGGGAGGTLTEILRLCRDTDKVYFLGGYSLAGLFSLWAAHQTDAFAGIAAASPSVWFPGFTDYMKNNVIRSRNVYLSLGDKEEKTKNRTMSKVGECIREVYTHLQCQGVSCALEWNQGGHFKEPEIRTARAFAWLLKSSGS